MPRILAAPNDGEIADIAAARPGRLSPVSRGRSLRRVDAEAQLEGFIARYSDAVAAQMRAARAAMRARLPGAVELVYDNYNALAIGYGPSERAGEAVFSIAAYPRWISLFFLRGAALDDPAGRLKGTGSQVRHIVLTDIAVFDDVEVRALMASALARAQPPIVADGPARTVIKSVSEKQRPRRPAER